MIAPNMEAPIQTPVQTHTHIQNGSVVVDGEKWPAAEPNMKAVFFFYSFFLDRVG